MASSVPRPHCVYDPRHQSPISIAPVTSHSRALYGLFPGCSRVVYKTNHTSTHGARTGHVRRRKRSPYESCRIWNALRISMRSPYTGIARGTRGVLRFIRPNLKCIAVSRCTGPVIWFDHENNTDVKSPRAIHSALRGRNRTGDKNRTGPVVGCEWVIRAFGMTSLNFVPKGSINNNPALVSVMDWCQIGYKPLSELSIADSFIFYFDYQM